MTVAVWMSSFLLLKKISFYILDEHFDRDLTNALLNTTTQLLIPIGSPTKPGERVASQWGLDNTPSSYPLVPV
jgi:hypothetical protein